MAPSPKSDSLQWLNLKGKVKSVRQIKYEMLDTNKRTTDSSLERWWTQAPIKPAYEGFLMDNSYLSFKEDGKIDKWIEYSASGEEIAQLSLEYTSNLPSKISFDISDDTLLIIYHTYNKKGQKVETILDLKRNHYDFYMTIKYLYNSKNHLQSTSMIVDTDTGYTFYSQLSDTNILWEHIEEFNSVYFKGMVSLNEKGDVIKSGEEKSGARLPEDKDPEIPYFLNYEYTYDAQGNWLTRRNRPPLSYFDMGPYHFNFPDIVWERKIEYY